MILRRFRNAGSNTEVILYTVKCDGKMIININKQRCAIRKHKVKLKDEDYLKLNYHCKNRYGEVKV
jgi:hypothetical protein